MIIKCFKIVYPSPPAFSAEAEEEKVEVLVKPTDDIPSKEDKEEVQMETPEICRINRYSPSRRSAKSRLGLISVNQGFHSVKLPPQRRPSYTPEMRFNSEQVMYTMESFTFFYFVIFLSFFSFLVRNFSIINHLVCAFSFRLTSLD